jgi:MFS family permease
LNIALPRMAAELDGMPLFSWAISIPALATAVTSLIFGKLSDMYGRRIMLLTSTCFMLAGAFLSALSREFSFLIISLSLLGLGQGAIQPLCFSVLGDIYTPTKRGKWAGLLNISSGLAALIVPTLSGWLVDNLTWRYIFWLEVPLILITGITVLKYLAKQDQREPRQVDLLGSIFLTSASITMILGISLGGNAYGWGSHQVLGLLAGSAISWTLFLRQETRASDPLLDLRVLTNRTFLVASLSALLSLFGMTAIMVYYPLFLQGVQNVSATLSGQVMTPFSVMMSLMGIPAGLIIARTRRYRWMYIAGYAVLTLVMFGTVAFKADTPIGWGFLVTSIAGIGLGAIPTINALVVQYAVPKNLLGTATGGLYFFVMMGRSIAPAILGTLMNSIYNRDLNKLLPASLNQILDQGSLADLNNPRLLLSSVLMAELQEIFSKTGEQGTILFEKTVLAVRSALENGLHTIFWIGAITMLLSFLIILAIKEIPLEDGIKE